MPSVIDLRRERFSPSLNVGDTRRLRFTAASGSGPLASVAVWLGAWSDLDSSTGATVVSGVPDGQDYLLDLTGPATSTPLRLVLNGAVAGVGLLRGSLRPSDDNVPATVTVTDGDALTVVVTVVPGGGGGGAGLSDANPAALGATAAPGTGVLASRDDHVHPRPTPGDIGAATAAQGATADSAVQPGGLAPVATSGAYADLSGRPAIPDSPDDIGAEVAGAAAVVAGDLTAHEAETTGVHGLAGLLAGKVDASSPRLGPDPTALPDGRMQVTASGLWVERDAGQVRTALGLGDAATRNVGVGAGTVASGDAPPNLHASSHADGGTDEITVAESQVTGLTAALAAKAAVADLTSTERLGGTAPRAGNKVTDWLGLIDASATTPVDVVCIGDSFGTINGRDSWPWLLERLLATLPPTNQPIPTQGWAAATGITGGSFDTMTGSANTSTTGGQGCTLATGNTATIVATATTGITVYYRDAASAGNLIVRDGVGGTVLGTVDADTGVPGLKRWTSASLASGNRTYQLEASAGSVVVDAAYAHHGNRTTGVRVLNASRSGATTADYVSTPARGLDLISVASTAGTLGLVVIGTGTNDGGGGAANLEALVTAVRAVDPDVPICCWVPYVGSIQTGAAMAARLAKAIELGLIVASGATLLPDAQVRWTSGDAIHPLTAAQKLIAEQMFLALSGDPIGRLLRLLRETVLPLTGGTLTGDLTVPSLITNSSVRVGADSYMVRPGAGRFGFHGSVVDLFTGVFGARLDFRTWATKETTDPAAPAADEALVYARDNGSGSTQIVARFSSGSPAVIAEQGLAVPAHSHPTADLNAGTLAVARGGTGLTTSDLTGQAGKTVRVNPGETGYEVAAAPTSPPPPMTAGAYGVPWSTLASNSSGHTTQVTLADYWYVGAVFPAYRDLTITTLRMRVTTAGAAGCTTRLAIYQLPSSGQIDGTMTLVSDCGTIPTDTSAPVTLTLSSLSVPLTAGSSYAFAFCSSLGVSFWRSAWQPTTGPSTATFGSEMVYAAFVAAPYGAAPATLTASAAPSGTETGWRTFVTARWT